MTAPSTRWQQVVAPDEEQRHRDQAELFVQMQQRKSARFGTGRALHRKQRPALRACACRKICPCRLSRMAIFVDDSAERVLPIYVEAFDLIGFERLGPTSQRRRASE